jgi:hypothetical protein
MDAESKNLFRDRLDARNSKPSSEIEVGQKGRILYFKRGDYVHSGTKQ